MSALQEIILDCIFCRPITSALMFSETDSILAHREAFPALRFITVLVPNVMGVPLGRDKFNTIEVIKRQMPLLYGYFESKPMQ